MAIDSKWSSKGEDWVIERFDVLNITLDFCSIIQVVRMDQAVKTHT